MKIQDHRLEDQLRRGLESCYLVSGDEPLLVREALDRLRAAARAAGFDSRELHVQLQGFDWAAIHEAGQALSLFSSRQLVELRLPTGKPGVEGSAAIAGLVERCGPDLLLIVETPRLDQKAARTRWVKAIESAGAHVQTRTVGGRDLPGWVGDRMRAAGLKPDRDAVRMIAERVEGNLLAADQEIEKLRLLHGEGSVSADDVMDAVVDSSRFDIFQLADAALAGRLDRVIRILDSLRAEGVPAPVIIWVVARDLRSLVMLAETAESGGNIAQAMNRARIWRARADLMRRCLGRHRKADFLDMLNATRHAEAVAKGQAAGDFWQRLTNILWRLAERRSRAA